MADRQYERYAFKDGKLYHFRDGTVTVMRGWPRPMAWKKRRYDLVWRPFRPKLLFVSTAKEDDGRFSRIAELRARLHLDPVEEFLAGVPSEIRALVAPFTQRHWHLLALAARCPGATDLLASNPALAFALASNWVFHEPAVARPLRAARALLPRRQREIAAWLGFPNPQAAANVLRKLAPEGVRILPLLRLRRLMADAAFLKQLGHLPSIPAPVLEVILSPRLRQLATPRLLAEMAARDGWGFEGQDVRARLWHVRTMLERTATPPRPIRSLRHLDTLHDELVVAFNGTCLPVALRCGRINPGWDIIPDQVFVFPSPPVPGAPGIEPITSAEELREEGRAMNHCVGALAGEVAAGRLYVYRVLAPERATLSLRPTREGWVLDELHGPRNARVGAKVGDVVTDWLSGRGLPCSRAVYRFS